MTWLHPFRRSLETILKSYGYELKERTRPLRGPTEFFAHISEKGFHPRTIVDVGVAYGTPWLYDSFSKSYLVLIEPNDDFIPYLKTISDQRDGEFHIFAAGESEYDTILRINVRRPTSSSLLEISTSLRDMIEANNPPMTLEEKPIQVRPLDSIYSTKFEKPILIKIDTEGYELSVVAGAGKFLDNTEIVIAEVNVRKRFEGSYSFCDFINAMRTRKFHLYDVIDLGQFGRDGPLMYMDAVFVREDSDLW